MQNETCEMKRNEIYQNETKRNGTEQNKMKRKWANRGANVYPN
jgi:hypothetical protein